MADDTEAVRRRRLRFQAWHRGTKEMDLILGTYADRHLADMSGPELERFERIIEVPDRELYAWICGTEEAPPEHRGELLDGLRSLCLEPGDYS